MAVLAYRGVVRALARLVAPGRLEAATYLRGSHAHDDAVPGLSDFDLAIVTRSAMDAERARRRWRRLAEHVPGLARAVHLAVYDQASLEVAAAASTLTASRPVHLPPAAVDDEAGLLVRPGLRGPWGDWRLATGPERRPPAAAPDADERRIAGWLELQFCWRGAFWGCTRPQSPMLARLCVKLVADPARIWLWLAHGERVTNRRAALQRARSLLPEEEQALSSTLALERALPDSPGPPLGEALAALVRLSDRIARHVAADGVQAGTERVRLVGAGAGLALAPYPLDGLGNLLGHEPRLLPLADWRALAWPLFPDDAFCPTELDPRDPKLLGAAVAVGGGYGPYPSMRGEEVMVLAGPGILRAVQCPATDPVSFALVDGADHAVFSELAGWSARDSARRAVAEHRAWLGSDHDVRVPPIRAWQLAQDRTTAAEWDVLGWLLSAARAGLFWESLHSGDPQLAVTVAGAATALDARSGGAVGEEAVAAYRQCRAEGGSRPPRRVVSGLREAVLRLPAFAHDVPWRERAPGRLIGTAG